MENLIPAFQATKQQGRNDRELRGHIYPSVSLRYLLGAYFLCSAPCGCSLKSPVYGVPSTWPLIVPANSFTIPKAGDRAVVTHITCWHPKLTCQSADEIMSSDFTLDDARQTIAREYGFADWSDVEARGAHPPDLGFELAVDALLRGDVEKLRGLLTGDPSLVHQRSSFGHRSTLLHYIASNGVETYRQRVPLNLAEITRLLLETGADVNATSNMYGGGSTTLGLLVTSDHLPGPVL